MGCFSWMFADKGNKVALHMGDMGYLICPDGTVHATSGGYDGYGHFGDRNSIDVYEAVADWNREVFPKQPDCIVPRRHKKISAFAWWPYYSDLSLSPEEIQKIMRETTGGKYWEYRYIGIDIACYDDQNANLPYPIKIASVPNVSYSELPPSNGDPNQGFRDD